MVTCLNTVLPAKNDYRSPESKKSAFGNKDSSDTFVALSPDCFLLGEGGIKPQSAIHLEGKLESHKQFLPM